MKKILTIVGARPQFIKCAALSPAVRKVFKEVILHTGQHYDYEMSAGIFKELNIPEPDYNLEIGSDTACKQIARMLIKLDDILDNEKPDAVIVFGDTNSTAAGSIAAAKHQVPLVHVEAGLREFNKSIPEESNKLITDILTDFYMCPTQTGVDILKSMGITSHVYNIGDVMIDLDYRYQDSILGNLSALREKNIESKSYYFLTCHRDSNTSDVSRLKGILEAVGQLELPVVFPIHPRTAKTVNQSGLEYLLNKPHINVVKPMGYLETQTLIAHAKAVLTDSGGVTKEAYFFKTPGIILDTQTEWVETVNEGWNQVIGPDTQKILDAVKNLIIPTIHSNCLGDGKASEKIVEILAANL